MVGHGIGQLNYRGTNNIIMQYVNMKISVLFSTALDVHAGCDKQDSLMLSGLHFKRTSTLTAINYCTADRRNSWSHSHRSESQILVDNRDFCLPHLHLTPLLGGGVPSEYCHKIWCGKLEWYGYPIVKNFEDMFIRLNRIHKHEGRTDRQTDGHRVTA